MASARRLFGFSRWHHAALCFVLLATLVAACSLIFDRGPDQCSHDTDCATFGEHLTCQAGVCSQLGPSGCYAGTPQSSDQFAIQCSKAQCEPFDNCQRLGICHASDPLPNLVTPPDAAPAPVVDASLIDAAPPPTPTNCQDPSRNTVVVGGSTAVQPFLSVVAPLLAQNTPPYQIVYQPSGSCTGVDGLFSTDPTKHVVKDIPGKQALLFHTDGSSEPCTFNPTTTLDVAASDVFASSCTPSYAVSDTLAEYLGPIQPMTFVVLSASTEKAISSEMGHVVFGRGNTDPTSMPYNEPTLYFVRNSGSGTQQMISRAISVDAKQWWGIDRGGSSAVRDLLEAVNPSRANAAIGILSTDFTDPERQRLRILAFQGKGQLCGYYPDSSVNTRDKINVRDGHYQIWGPVHFFAQVSQGIPSPAAAALVTRFTTTRLEQALLDKIITSGLVPACAMKVKRTTEMGPISADVPEASCGCYFEAKVPGGQPPPECKTCAGPADCSMDRPACNNGYCEPR